MMVLISTDGIRVPEVGISLSADSGCNEQRTAVGVKIIMWLLNFFQCEDSEWKLDILLSDSFTISSVTQANYLS